MKVMIDLEKVKDIGKGGGGDIDIIKQAVNNGFIDVELKHVTLNEDILSMDIDGRTIYLITDDIFDENDQNDLIVTVKPRDIDIDNAFNVDDYYQNLKMISDAELKACGFYKPEEELIEGAGIHNFLLLATAASDDPDKKATGVLLDLLISIRTKLEV